MGLNKKYGWYSAKQYQLNGHVVWTRPDGSLVYVTEVSEDGPAWPDAVNVGEVTEWHSGTLKWEENPFEIRRLTSFPSKWEE